MPGYEDDMNPTPEHIEKARLIVYRWQKRWTDAGETCMPHVDDLQDRISVALSDAEQSASADDCDDVDAMLAALPPALTWTTEKPVKPGWYWWRYGARRKASVMHITQGHVQNMEVFTVGMFAMFINEVPGEWAGPIDPPQ